MVEIELDIDASSLLLPWRVSSITTVEIVVVVIITVIIIIIIKICTVEQIKELSK